jgi:predicted metalloendopeptidase
MRPFCSRAEHFALFCLLTICLAANSVHGAVSGIKLDNNDASVRPQDNFYRYVNGTWLANAKIPDDLPAYGSYWTLREDTQEQLRAIIEAAAGQSRQGSHDEGSKIGRLYASFMNERRLERLGTRPLASEFAHIHAIRDKREIPALMAHLEQIGVHLPCEGGIEQDRRDSSRYVFELAQSGLGLPDRDYYLKDDEPTLVRIRDQYQSYIAASLARLGDRDAATEAAAIVALETLLARAQWTKVQNRDPVKTYNRLDIDKLGELAGPYDWRRYLGAMGVAGKIDSVVVLQPSYLTAFAAAVSTTPLSTWKAYLRWQLFRQYASFLSKPYVDERFAFYGTALFGIPQNRPRWRRGVALVDSSIAEALGKLYVAKYFSQASKQRVEAMVQNLLEAYRQEIEGLTWMGADTKRQALAKLAMIKVKMAYPDTWRDYSKLRINQDDLVGNVMRARQFESDWQLAKLGKPVDRSEWHVSPQTVNAYYSPLLNEIVFPAAYLQPPMFNALADDAVNYGAIGTSIGHEISHGFDDKGSQYDGDGNLRNWWTAEDRERFSAKTSTLVAEYGAFEPVKGYHVNGELTLGENIADNAGLAVSYKAWKISLGGKDAVIIDGLTGDQRFFMGFAQRAGTLDRDNMVIMWIKTDPHTPSEFRVNGLLMNQQAFYDTYAVKPGDRMYLPPEQRTLIW